VVLARKLRMPGNPECALGAIAESGEVYLNMPAEEMTAELQAYRDQECRHQMAEIARRRAVLRGGRGPADVHGRSVIVTDDGIATGSTMIAALRTLRGQKPLETVVAVPVAAPDRLQEVQRECDAVVCLITAPHLWAVGQFYHDFSQVEDEQVIEMLQRFSQPKALVTGRVSP